MIPVQFKTNLLAFILSVLYNSNQNVTEKESRLSDR